MGLTQTRTTPMDATKTVLFTVSRRVNNFTRCFCFSFLWCGTFRTFSEFFVNFLVNVVKSGETSSNESQRHVDGNHTMERSK